MKRQGYEVSLGDHGAGQWIAAVIIAALILYPIDFETGAAALPIYGGTSSNLGDPHGTKNPFPLGAIFAWATMAGHR